VDKRYRTLFPKTHRNLSMKYQVWMITGDKRGDGDQHLPCPASSNASSSDLLI
jgi:hypothetical protein